MAEPGAAVRPARSADELDEVRRLFRGFNAWHLGRQGADRDRLAQYFDEAAYAREVADLPGAYAEPEGTLLLAWLDGDAVGCVAMKRLGPDACEMKRMFVEDRGRGTGTGRLLAEEVVERARRAGYAAMFLDTSRSQVEAIGLYRSLGFEEVPPYYDVPADLRDWLVYFRLTL